MAGWPSLALGWGGASRRPQRSDMLSHGVHFSSLLKETADGEGVEVGGERAEGYNKKA